MSNDGWFPRISPNGRDLMTGATSLSVSGRAVRQNAISGAWLNDTTVVYRRHDTGEVMLWEQGKAPVATGIIASWVDAANGRWIASGGDATTPIVYLSDERMFPGFGGGMAPCAIAPNGACMMGSHEPGDMHVLLPGQMMPYAVDVPGGMTPRASAYGFCWANSGRILVLPHDDATVRDVTIEREEFWPVLIDGPDGPYILSHGHTRLILRKLGASVGWVVAEGVTRYPDGKWTGNDFYIVWSDDGGNPGSRRITLKTPHQSLVVAGVTPGGGNVATHTGATTVNLSALLAAANTKSALIAPQLGLLEDDIVYRLSLLCVNVLEPLKRKYPNIVIKSGFRQVNTGISQHELGEAADIQITNQTPLLLYEVAAWMEANLHFDQLILNFTQLGDGKPWIHVSFSPASLRQQVLTKDYADQFHEGLFLVQPYSAEEGAAILRTQQRMDSLIVREMAKQQLREQRLAPKTTVLDESVGAVGGVGGASGSSGAGGSGGSGGSAGPGAQFVPDYYNEVAYIANKYPAEFNDAHHEELGDRAYAFIKLLARHLYYTKGDTNVGLNLRRGTGPMSWDALAYKTSYGTEVIDVIIGAGGGNPQPAWQVVAGPAGWVQP